MRRLLGKARSNIENGLNSWSAPHIGMGQDCFWEQRGATQRGSHVPYQSEEQISCSVHSLCCSSLFLEAVSSHTKVRIRSAVQSILYVAPSSPRYSLVPYKSKEHHFCGALLTEKSVLAEWPQVQKKSRQLQGFFNVCQTLEYPYKPRLLNHYVFFSLLVDGENVTWCSPYIKSARIYILDYFGHFEKNVWKLRLGKLQISNFFQSSKWLKKSG